MKKKLIQFKNIVKSYEDGKVVLKGKTGFFHFVCGFFVLGFHRGFLRR